MGRIGCPDTSVPNYRSPLRKILKERRSRRKMNCSGKVTLEHVTQTQLILINGILHCCMFRFLGNHHQTIHTKHVKHLNGCVVHVSHFESIVRLPSDCSLWDYLQTAAFGSCCFWYINFFRAYTTSLYQVPELFSVMT